MFGSFAYGTIKEDSDFVFYIVVRDDVLDLAGATAQAYRAIRRVKQRPVDLIVGPDSGFEHRTESPSVESEVYQKGVWLYGASN